MELEEKIALAQWWKELRETNNESFLPLFFDEHRYLVLKGGGGSGKSIFAGRKVLERVTTEPGHRYLVCRKVARTLRESCFAQLRGQLARHYPDVPAQINKTDMTITLPESGSVILFAGLDDAEKLKSIYDVTGIWIEEASELLKSDFDQLDIRLRTDFSQYLQMILSFNPISITHWLKGRFFDRRDPRALVHESTYRDNRFLTREAIETLESFRETDEYYYMVYCLGQWGVTGKTVFDAKALSKRLTELTPPQRKGLFTYEDDGLQLKNIRWEDEKEGCVNLYREAERGAPYVIGADTAGEGSDFFVAQVLDNRTGEQVCVLRGRFDEDVFARQLYCLGKHYNDALIGAEANFSTYPIRELERLGYRKQYVRETMDEYTHKVRQSYGFRTDGRTRPVIIAELVRAVRESAAWLHDEATILEMLTFVRASETLRPEAEAGAHDDCVMSLAIAQHIRPQQSYLSERGEDARTEWSASQWEDYEAASTAERRMLIEKWGRPKGR